MGTSDTTALLQLDMEALMVVVVVVLIIVAVIVTAAHSWAAVPRSQPEPRELVRRALAVIPAGPDRVALQRAIHRATGTDPRVDVVVIEPASDDLPSFERLAPRVTVLRHAAVRPTADALRVGAARGLVAGYDAVIELCVEHSRMAHSVTALLDALDDGAHVAVGSRHVPGSRIRDCGSCRRLISRGANRLLGRLTRVPLRDVTARIRAYRREAIELAVLPARAQDHAFGVEVLLRCRHAGLRIAEVPVTAAGPVCARTSIADARAMVGRALQWRRAAGADRLRGIVHPLTTAFSGR